MGDKSAIQWTDATWNPVTGCSKVSPGCAHCYAETLSHRFGWTESPWTPENAADNVVMRQDRIDQPLRWRKPRRVFVNSMSDLFHELVPDEFVDQVFAVMSLASRHTFQVLTKRPERMRAYVAGAEARVLARRWQVDPLPPESLGWPLPNVWLGTSVENQHWADVRVPDLLGTPAAVRFLSMEPLLGPVDLDRMILSPHVTEIRGCLYRVRCSRCGAPGAGSYCTWCGHGEDVERPAVDWVIVGGESGAGARPMEEQWVRDIVGQVRRSDAAVFVKQMGERWAADNGFGRTHAGRMEDWPADLQVREWPAGSPWA